MTFPPDSRVRDPYLLVLRRIEMDGQPALAQWAAVNHTTGDKSRCYQPPAGPNGVAPYHSPLPPRPLPPPPIQQERRDPWPSLGENTGLHAHPENSPALASVAVPPTPSLHFLLSSAVTFCALKYIAGVTGTVWPQDSVTTADIWAAGRMHLLYNTGVTQSSERDRHAPGRRLTSHSHTTQPKRVSLTSCLPMFLGELCSQFRERPLFNNTAILCTQQYIREFRQ